MREIRVCDYCGVPLIWTFCWAYKERYCLNCGRMGGMLGMGTNVKLTPKLKYQYKVIYDVWKAIYKNLTPRTDYSHDGCKKCSGANHRRHLSKKEILKDKTATKILEKLAEGFLPKQKVKRSLENG